MRNHLGLRRVLREDAALRDEYSEVKRALASTLAVAEMEAYVEGKSAIVRRILLVAGLTSAELDDVEDVNRAG